MFAGEFHRCLGKLLLNVLVDVETARCDANLPVIPELSGDSDFRADFGIGIGEDNKRCVAAQL